MARVLRARRSTRARMEAAQACRVAPGVYEPFDDGVCFFRAVRRCGVRLVALEDAPVRALTDGKALLQSLGKDIGPLLARDAKPGHLYVAWDGTFSHWGRPHFAACKRRAFDLALFGDGG